MATCEENAKDKYRDLNLRDSDLNTNEPNDCHSDCPNELEHLFKDLDVPNE